MTAKTDRPMSEHESALFQAIRVLGLAVIEKGGNRQAIEAGLEDVAAEAEDAGRTNEAATLRLLSQAILEATTDFVAKPSN